MRRGKTFTISATILCTLHGVVTNCETCPTGFFRNITSTRGTVKDSCTAHTKCAPGKYTDVSGTATTQPKCETCVTGFFKAFTSSSSTETDSCFEDEDEETSLSGGKCLGMKTFGPCLSTLLWKCTG